MFFSVLKFDPNQPRDKNGRWSAQGGGAATAFSAEINKRRRSIDQIVSDTFHGDAATIADYHTAAKAALDAVANGGETWRSHVENLADVDAKRTKRLRFTRARLKEQAAIIDHFLKDAHKYKAKEGEKPEVIFLAGRGGSGKSSFNKNQGRASGVFSEDTHLLLDSDEVKAKMKEYNNQMAFLVHRESSLIFDRMVNRARAMGLNVVLDMTMKSKQDHVIDAFKKRGYDMQAHYMHMPPEGSTERALQRWAGKGPGKRGRLVPAEVVLGMTNNEKNFDRITSKMNKGWSLWANDRPREEGPRRIAGSAHKAEFAVIFKANPYRDALGRFASKMKAVRTTSFEDDMMAQMKWFGDEAKKLGKASLEALLIESPDEFAKLGRRWRRYHAFKGEGFVYVLKANPYRDAFGRFASRASRAASKVVGKYRSAVDMVNFHTHRRKDKIGPYEIARFMAIGKEDEVVGFSGVLRSDMTKFRSAP